MSVAVKAQGLAFSFEAHKVLVNIDLAVGSGEIAAILGSSGSGKSTLLRLLAGLLPQSSGSIEFDQAKFQPAFVFQEASLLPWLTIEQNLLLANKFSNQRESPRQARQKCHEICEVVNLLGHEHKHPRELSGGMKMRASFGRALMSQPDLLFLDEPFSALDELTRWDLQDWLLRWQKTQKTTVFLVTHSLSEAVLMADRIFLLGPQPAQIEDRFHFSERVARDSNAYLERVRAVKARVLPILSRMSGAPQ